MSTASAKDLLIRPIASRDANRVIAALHYSGKYVQNSQLHLGVFLDGKCGGALQFGPSLDKRKLMGLVAGTKWNEFLELNRMAMADWLPRNGESRAIACAMRFIRKHYPWMKWIVSFSDGTQCGDGTIYRASGFLLTGIKKNNQIWEAPTGEIFNDTSLRPGIGSEVTRKRAAAVFSRASLTGHSCKGQQREAAELLAQSSSDASGTALETGASSMKAYKAAGWKPKTGFQLRYIYFLDRSLIPQLTAPVIPFGEIDRQGAGMYLGQPRVRGADNGIPGDQSEGGGVNPTRTLQTNETDGE